MFRFKRNRAAALGRRVRRGHNRAANNVHSSVRHGYGSEELVEAAAAQAVHFAEQEGLIARSVIGDVLTLSPHG
jgi:hypothetical protein